MIRIMLLVAVGALAVGCGQPAAPRTGGGGSSHRDAAGDQQARFPIRWTPEWQADAAPGHLEALLDKPVETGGNELMWSHDGKDEQIITGRDYLRAVANGYVANTTYEITIESFFIRLVVPLRLFSHAKPARQSYLADFRVDDDPLHRIPPILNGMETMESDREIRRAMAEGKDWAALWPDTVVESHPPYQVTLTEPGGVTNLRVLGWADFNGDGIEDIMLFMATYANGGSMRYYTTVVLTRLRPGGPLEVVSQE